jgi:ATP-binding cassette subfamily C (CFTR/MRP) protein 1
MVTIKICHFIYGILQLVTLILIISSVSGVQKTRVTILNAVFNAVIAIFLLILSYFEHLRNVRPSSILTVYFGATAVFDAVRTRTLYSMDDNKTYVIIFSVSTIFKIIIFFLEALDKRSHLRLPFSKIPKETTIGIFRRNFFWWLNPLLWLGYKNNIPISDLDPIDERLESSEGHKVFYDKWLAINPKTPGALTKLLISQYKWQLLIAVPSRLAQTGFTFAQPFLITRVSKFVIEPNMPLTSEIGFGLIAATAIIYAGLALTTANNQHKTYRVITAFRGSLVSLLYRGTLPLSSADVRSSSATTLMSADVERVGTGMRYLHEVWASPIDIGLAIWLLERQLGAAAVMPGAIFLRELCLLCVFAVYKLTWTSL